MSPAEAPTEKIWGGADFNFKYLGATASHLSPNTHQGLHSRPGSPNPAGRKKGGEGFLTRLGSPIVTKEHDDGADVRVVDDLRAVGKAQRQHPTGVGPGLEKRRLAEGMQNTTKGSS